MQRSGQTSQRGAFVTHQDIRNEVDAFGLALTEWRWRFLLTDKRRSGKLLYGTMAYSIGLECNELRSELIVKHALVLT